MGNSQASVAGNHVSKNNYDDEYAPRLDNNLLDQLSDKALGYDVDSIGEFVEGGLSYVYSINKKFVDADDLSVTTRKVALKVTTEQRIRTLCHALSKEEFPKAVDGILRGCAREAENLKQLSHSCIVSFIASMELTGQGDTGRMFVLVMEYCNGKTLANKIEKQRSSQHYFPEFIIKRWFFQLAMAVAYAHSKDILHLDIKPSNIFIFEYNEDVVVKLADFGLAQKIQAVVDPNTSKHSTLARGMLTAHYCSYDRLLNKPAVPKDDTFSFGVSLHETAALDCPFHGSVHTVSGDIDNDERRKLVDYGFSMELSQCVDRLLARHVTARPTMDVVVDDPWFHNGGSHGLEQVVPKENIWLHLSNKIDKQTPLDFCNSVTDRALRIWLYSIKEERYPLLLQCYENWTNEMARLMEVYELAAKVIGDKTFLADAARIAGSSIGIVGAGIGFAGIVITATTLGVLSPIGVGLMIAGAAIGLPGAATNIGATAAEMVTRRREIAAAIEAEGPAREAERALAEAAQKLTEKLPKTELAEEFARRLTSEDLKDMAKWKQAVKLSHLLQRSPEITSAAFKLTGDCGQEAKAVKAMVAARLLVRSADIAADVLHVALQPVAKVAAGVGIALLPVGALLDIGTIALAAVNIARTVKAKENNETPPSVEDAMNKFMASLHCREKLMKSRMEALEAIMKEKIKGADALPKIGNAPIIHHVHIAAV